MYEIYLVSRQLLIRGQTFRADLKPSVTVVDEMVFRK